MLRFGNYSPFEGKVASKIYKYTIYQTLNILCHFATKSVLKCAHVQLHITCQTKCRMHAHRMHILKCEREIYFATNSLIKIKVGNNELMIEPNLDYF